MANVALIGAGGVSRLHVAAWLKADGARVVGVSDLVPELAQKAAGELGSERWTTDYRELLDWADVDAVDVCTTENTHGQIASEAAARGKHILVEKPIATTLADADRIIDAANASGVKLMVAQTHRFYDYSRSARDAIDSGEIGTPVYVRLCTGGGFWNQDWTGKRISPGDTGGNVVTNGVHLADTLNFWLGSRPVSVYAQARNVTSAHLQMDDYFMFTIRYESGAIGVCELSRANVPRSNSFESTTILGTGGELNTGTQHSSRWTHGDGGLAFGEPEIQQGFDAEIQAFVDCLAEGRTPPVSGEDGRLALEVCLAAGRSIESGEVVLLGEGG
jgi:predicted dehydrogenase